MSKVTVFMILGLISFGAGAACTEYPSGFGGKTIRCDDGNNYDVTKNQLLDTTTIRGSNPYTGSQWQTEIRGNNSLLGPSMKGTDKDGNRFDCRMNSLTNKWDCN